MEPAREVGRELEREVGRDVGGCGFGRSAVADLRTSALPRPLDCFWFCCGWRGVSGTASGAAASRVFLPLEGGGGGVAGLPLALSLTESCGQKEYKRCRAVSG